LYFQKEIYILDSEFKKFSESKRPSLVIYFKIPGLVVTVRGFKTLARFLKLPFCI